MSDRTTTIQNYVPPHLREAEPHKSIYKAMGTETGSLLAAIDSVLEQMYVATATWGLSLWEAFLGIDTDTTKEDDDRRAVISAKIRGIGTITKSMIANAALSFENGEIEITEYPASGYVNIKFVSVLGIPPNYQDFVDYIDDIKPAHLGVTFEHSCNINQTLEAYTYGNLEAYTCGGVRTASL